MEASSLSLTHSSSFTQSIIAVNIAPWRLFSIELLCSIPVSLHPQVHPLLSFEFSLIYPFLTTIFAGKWINTQGTHNQLSEYKTGNPYYWWWITKTVIIRGMHNILFSPLRHDLPLMVLFYWCVANLKNVSENSDQSKGTAPDVSSLLWGWTLKVSYKSFGNEAGETRNQSLSLWHWIISHVSSISLIICM